MRKFAQLLCPSACMKGNIAQQAVLISVGSGTGSGTGSGSGSGSGSALQPPVLPGVGFC